MPKFELARLGFRSASSSPQQLSPWCDTCPLRALSLFEDFRREELDFMMRLKIAHRYAQRGTTLIQHDEANGQLYTLFSGWAVRYIQLPDGRRQISEVLLPGDTMGLDSVVGLPTRYSVQAVADVTYCALDARLLSEKLPTLAHRLARLAIAAQRRFENRLTVVGRCRAEERIAYFVVDLYDRLERRCLINEGGFRFPMTQQQLADAVGLNTIHTNRILRRLREQQIMSVQDHRVEIRDLARLRRLASVTSGEEQRPLL